MEYGHEIQETRENKLSFFSDKNKHPLCASVLSGLWLGDAGDSLDGPGFQLLNSEF